MRTLRFAGLLLTFGGMLEDDDLAAVRSAIHEVSAEPKPPFSQRGGSPALTALKHQPQAWIQEVRLLRHAAYPEALIVKTGAGIRCGYDESIYLYVWTGKKWLRRLESEQNDYTPGVYQPQRIEGIEVSERNQRGERYRHGRSVALVHFELAADLLAALPGCEVVRTGVSDLLPGSQYLARR